MGAVVEYLDPMEEEEVVVVVASLVVGLGVAVVGDHHWGVEEEENPRDMWDDLVEDLLTA